MEKMLLTRRGRFGCRLYGDPAMPPLVLLTGLGMNAASWPEPFLTRLVRKGLYVIAPDNRDSGSSMLGTESVSKTRMFASIAKYIAGGSVHAEYRLEDMAADTESIMDELGIERAHIAGISMGGMIAQVFACRAPHRTVSLTSMSSATGNVITGVGNPVAAAGQNASADGNSCLRRSARAAASAFCSDVGDSRYGRSAFASSRW